jgi:hypothetical protein
VKINRCMSSKHLGQPSRKLKRGIGSTLTFRGMKLIYLNFKYSTIYLLRTGCCTYPSYFRIEFVFQRAKYQSLPVTIDPSKLELQSKIVELCSNGWSFPAIARHLDISVGTVWNITNTIVAEYHDKLDSLE